MRLVALPLPLLCACAPEPLTGPPAPGSRPDLLLVVVEGLRDGTGALADATTHFAAATGHTAARVPATYTASIHAYPGLVALLSGRFASAVPVCSRPVTPLGQAPVPTPSCVTIPADVPLLGEVLGYYGYAASFWGPATPDDPSALRGMEAHVGEDIATALPAWWAGHADAPRFAVVDAPLDLDAVRAVAAATDEGALELSWDASRRGALDPADIATYHAPYGGGAVAEHEGDLVAAYAAAAATAGRAVGHLLDTLGGPGRPFVAAVTSTYGVSLGEYGGTSMPEMLVPARSTLVLERTAHVPLLLYGLGAVDVVRPTSVVDLVPTFCALAGATPPQGLSGHDLLGPDAGAGPTWTEFGDMLATRDGDRLYTVRAYRHGSSSLDGRLTERLHDRSLLTEPGAVTAYDVVHDPWQQTDLASAPAVKAAALERLTGLRDGPAAPRVTDAPTPVAAEVQAIRAQGYW